MEGNEPAQSSIVADKLEGLAQSCESMKRIGRELNDLDNSEGFREYRFITQELENISIKRKSIPTSGVLTPNDQFIDVDPKKLADQNTFLK